MGDIRQDASCDTPSLTETAQRANPGMIVSKDRVMAYLSLRTPSPCVILIDLPIDHAKAHHRADEVVADCGDDPIAHGQCRAVRLCLRPDFGSTLCVTKPVTVTDRVYWYYLT